MYRAGLEAILGVTQEGNVLRIKPCIAKDWQGFEFDWQFGETIYQVKVMQGDDATYKKQKDVQKISAQEFTIALRDDGGMRQITLPMMQT